MRTATCRGLQTARVSGPATSRHRGCPPILGADWRAEASHLEAPLAQRHGRPARPGSPQYSLCCRRRSDTGARARWEPPPSPEGAPSASRPSAVEPPSPAEPPPLAEPLRVRTAPGPSPLPAARVSPAPSASEPSARRRVARRVPPPPSRCERPSRPRASAAGPPRSSLAARTCPRRKVRTALHAPDPPAEVFPGSRHSLRCVRHRGRFPGSQGGL